MSCTVDSAITKIMESRFEVRTGVKNDLHNGKSLSEGAARETITNCDEQIEEQ